eukprot:m.102035 g.102035  ORF g.102035 m.102035 type:complete len:444 (+) comp37152_c0_seq13:563-1894(+)
MRKDFGCYCRHHQQSNGRCRNDYEVSFLCPCRARLPVPYQCLHIPKPKHGLVNVVFKSDTSGVVKALSYFSCQSNFKLIGNRQAACVQNKPLWGKKRFAWWRRPQYTFSGWDPRSVPICKPDCPFPYPTSPSNGNVVVQSDSARRRYTASYSCNAGFTLIGKSRKTCFKNSGGIYTGWTEKPVCELSVFAKLRNRQCSFSNKLAEANRNCAFANTEGNDMSWREEMSRSSTILQTVQRIHNVTLHRCHAVTSMPPILMARVSVQRAPVSLMQHVSVARKKRFDGSTFTLSLTISKTLGIQTAAVVVGPFNSGQAPYLRFILDATSGASTYWFQAYVYCLPGGSYDSIGSVKDPHKNASYVANKPLAGQYCLNLKDTVECDKRFSVILSFSVQCKVWERMKSIKLEVMPMGIVDENDCIGYSILNEEKTGKLVFKKKKYPGCFP